jgi:hypothetical protein
VKFHLQRRREKYDVAAIPTAAAETLTTTAASRMAPVQASTPSIGGSASPPEDHDSKRMVEGFQREELEEGCDCCDETCDFCCVVPGRIQCGDCVVRGPAFCRFHNVVIGFFILVWKWNTFRDPVMRFGCCIKCDLGNHFSPTPQSVGGGVHDFCVEMEMCRFPSAIMTPHLASFGSSG